MDTRAYTEAAWLHAVNTKYAVVTATLPSATTTEASALAPEKAQAITPRDQMNATGRPYRPQAPTP